MAQDAEKIARADAARRITAEPLYVEAWRVSERMLVQGWKDTAAEQREAREQIWSMLQHLYGVRKFFEDVIREGDDAKIMLDVKEADDASE